MTINVAGTNGTATPTGFPQTVGLTPTSTGCSSSLASTTCTLQLPLSPGSYSASISTFDGTSGAGNELSTAQAVAFTVVASQNNTVPLTLSGIPAQMDLTYQGSGKFSIVALDADANYIVGAGAPTFTVAKSGGATAVTITQPTTAQPNAFSIVGAAAGSETLTVTAGYPAGATSGCSQAGAVCTRSFTAANNQYVYAINYDGQNVLGFSVPFTSSSQTPAFNFSDGYYPYGNQIALDTKGDLFFASYYDYSEPVLEVAAGSASPISLFSTYAYGLATDSNNDLFVSSYENGNVEEYAPPYTGTAINTFTTSYPWSMALDSNNDLFVGNYDYSYITEYPYSGGSYGGPVEIPTGSEPTEVWFDASGDLWVGNSSSGTVEEFKPPFSALSTPAVTIDFTQNEYCPGVLDSSGDLFLSDYATSGVINEYKASTIAANQGGGTISSPDASFSGGEYPCVIGFDGSGNLYASIVDGFGNSDGGIAEFSPPFSNSSTPAYYVTSGADDPYGGGVMSKAGQLAVTL